MKALPKTEVITRSPEQLGQALNRFRKLQDQTQLQLSQLANIRQGTVSKVEKGVATTTLGAVYDICTALDLEIVIRPKSKTTKKKFNPEEIF
jgi:HTH-type transcriptional regulator / antitoxin HipB